MTSNFLDTMTLNIKNRLKQESISPVDMRHAAQTARQPLDFLQAFSARPYPRIIAEIKFASPTLGNIKAGDPVAIAKAYLRYGASAISVLTEPDYFQGSLQYLKQVREALPDALLLMKDFVLDEYQLLQARLYGADAILLIVGFLDDDLLKSLYTKAIELGLTPLVEVHTLRELTFAQSMGAKFIGVNNRNLQHLTVDLSTSIELIQPVSDRDDTVFISESGLKTATDLIHLHHLGYQGFLIGTQFMTKPSPGLALQSFLQGITHHMDTNHER